MLKRVVVIGAGEVGVTFSIFLSQLQQMNRDLSDIEILLIESSKSEQQGGKSAACINHETGYEYFKAGHQSTGKLCIEGAVTKRLLYPPGFHESQVPTRFFVSHGSSCDPDPGKRVSYADFKKNAELMKEHYAWIYTNLKTDFGWSDAEACMRLGHSPEGFGQELSPNEYSDIKDVVGGYRAAGGTVNMALDYAIKRAALDEADNKGALRRLTKTEIKHIRNLESGYIISTDQGDFPADFVVCSAAHTIPLLAAMGGGSGPSGTYGLNAMLYIQLPPTSDLEIQRRVSNVNFILQGDNGSMFACVLPPTQKEIGLAAIYFPSESGSQLAKFVYPKDGNRVPESWNSAITAGQFDGLEPRRAAILAQCFKFNPFLGGYLQATLADPKKMKMIVRTVFNPEVKGNPKGEDRRIREMLPPTPFTADGTIVSMASPKWTTVELASMTLLQYMLEKFDKTKLPQSLKAGFGPFKVDMCAISKFLHFRDIRFPKKYAMDYVVDLEFPIRLVPSNHPCFKDNVASEFSSQSQFKIAGQTSTG